MELYLHSMGIISGAGSNSQPDFLQHQPAPKEGKLLCAEPDYAGLIPPMQLRRMSKAVRIGIAASKLCMQQAGVEKPDAISIGTAMGCLQDTEIFLGKMVEQDEQMLTPTSFIQSTHNTVSGQIALLAGCHGHNLTFVQRGHSFEHALINAQLYIDDHPGAQMLAGGIDELTDNSFRAFTQGGIYSKNITAGEGASFFIVSDKAENSKVCIKDIHCFTADGHDEALTQVQAFITRNGINSSNTDVLMTGRNGDAAMNTFYDRVYANSGIGTEAGFKHLCGEYATASAFGLGVLLQAAIAGNLPEVAILKGVNTGMKQALMVSHFKHYYTCWYLQMV